MKSETPLEFAKQDASYGHKPNGHERAIEIL